MSISQQLTTTEHIDYIPGVFNPLENILFLEQGALDGKSSCSFEGFGFYSSL